MLQICSEVITLRPPLRGVFAVNFCSPDFTARHFVDKKRHIRAAVNFCAWTSLQGTPEAGLQDFIVHCALLSQIALGATSISAEAHSEVSGGCSEQ